MIARISEYLFLVIYIDVSREPLNCPSARWVFMHHHYILLLDMPPFLYIKFFIKFLGRLLSYYHVQIVQPPVSNIYIYYSIMSLYVEAN